MTDNNQVVRKLVAIAQVADSKEFRPAMRCINFTGDEAVVTDGFMLARTPIKTEPIKLDAHPIAQMKKGQEFDFENKQIKQNNTITTLNQMELDYPEYQKVIPTDNNHLSIGLGLPVLEKLIKVMKKNGDRFIKLEFNEDNMKPIKGTLEGIELFIMPYKVNNN